MYQLYHLCLMCLLFLLCQQKRRFFLQSEPIGLSTLTDFLPRFLGVLLIIGCFGYLIQSFVAFIAPNLVTEIAWLPLLTSWGELLVPVWLLIKGVNLEQWEKRALATT